MNSIVISRNLNNLFSVGNGFVHVGGLYCHKKFCFQRFQLGRDFNGIPDIIGQFLPKNISYLFGYKTEVSPL